MLVMDRTCHCCGAQIAEPRQSWLIGLYSDIPSQNVVAQNKGGGRFRYAELRNAYTLELEARKRIHQIPLASKKRRIFIARLYSGRGQERDRGNLVGGCKPLVDAMVRVGLLVNDTPGLVEDHYRQHRHQHSDGYKTLIRIEEI